MCLRLDAHALRQARARCDQRLVNDFDRHLRAARQGVSTRALVCVCTVVSASALHVFACSTHTRHCAVLAGRTSPASRLAPARAYLSTTVPGSSLVDVGIAALPQQPLQLEVLLTLPELQARPSSFHSGRTLLPFRRPAPRPCGIAGKCHVDRDPSRCSAHWWARAVLVLQRRMLLDHPSRRKRREACGETLGSARKTLSYSGMAGGAHRPRESD